MQQHKKKHIQSSGQWQITTAQDLQGHEQNTGALGQNIVLYLVRHGFSTANRYKGQKTLDLDLTSIIKTCLPHTEQSPSFRQRTRRKAIQYGIDIDSINLKTYKEEDAPLTRTGIIQSEIAQKYINFQVDNVYTSVLTRAQQTALLMFPGKKVEVAPWLKEMKNHVETASTPSENIPFSDVITQIEKRHQFLTSEQLGNLKYTSEVLEEDSECNYNNQQSKNGDILKFLQMFLLNKIGEPSQYTKHIVLVCHGGIIRNFINKACGETILNHMNNNQIIRINELNINDLIGYSTSGVLPKENMHILFTGFVNHVSNSCSSKNIIRKAFTREQELPYILRIPTHVYDERTYTIYTKNDVEEFILLYQQNAQLGKSRIQRPSQDVEQLIKRRFGQDYKHKYKTKQQKQKLYEQIEKAPQIRDLIFGNKDIVNNIIQMVKQYKSCTDPQAFEYISLIVHCVQKKLNMELPKYIIGETIFRILAVVNEQLNPI